MKIYLRRCHAQSVGDGDFSDKVDRVQKLYEILILKGHENRIVGSKATAILLNGWVWSIGELHHITMTV